ncbi:MAG: restriction endonuclease [Microthrixaceae bacterium]|nr:restriction endonuclease [Microthrixaceae bacterium]
MATLWGIHNDEPDLDLVGEGFVSVGWDVGDLREIGPDRARLKEVIRRRYPSAKEGAIPVWAGVLYRFAFEMEPGDLIISPNKADRTLNFGRVTGDYFFDPGAEMHRHRRPVEWTHTDVPRAQFSQNARYEIGSAVTLFTVNRHADEFLTFIDTGVPATTPELPEHEVEQATASAEDEPNAERIAQFTSDFVIEALHALGPYSFERFVAGLLEAMGYRAEVTQASGDGGFDVVAYRDPLGLEPPIIKVQCKRTVNTIGGPDVQKLIGTLSHGNNEAGLFVTLGAYTSDARHMARSRHDLRLIDGTQLVEHIYENYEKLDLEWRRLLPLRRLYVVDRSVGD